MAHKVEVGTVAFFGNIPVRVCSIRSSTAVEVEYPEGREYRRAQATSLSSEPRDFFGAHIWEEER